MDYGQDVGNRAQAPPGPQFVLLAFFFFLAAGPSWALDARKDIGHFIIEYWATDNSDISQNSVLSLLQTRDGYLWAGTYEGLCRFDGRHFTVFDKSNTPEMRNNGMLVMAEGPDGALWVGTPNGLLCRRNGAFRNFGAGDGLASDFILSLCPDADGGLWIGTTRGLSRYRDGTFSSLNAQAGLELSYVSALCVDRDGTLWVGTSTGLVSYRAGRFTRHALPGGKAGNTVWSLCASRDGTIWIGTAGEWLVSYRRGEIRSYSEKEGVSGSRVRVIYEDSNGILWFGTDNGGLNRLDGGVFTYLLQRHGLSNDSVRSLFEDHEGSLWVGTFGGGLNRLKDDRYIFYNTRNGLPVDMTRAVMQDRDGDFWIGTIGGGLVRFGPGGFRVFGARDGLASPAGVVHRPGQRRRHLVRHLRRRPAPPAGRQGHGLVDAQRHGQRHRARRPGCQRRFHLGRHQRRRRRHPAPRWPHRQLQPPQRPGRRFRLRHRPGRQGRRLGGDLQRGVVPLSRRQDHHLPPNQRQYAERHLGDPSRWRRRPVARHQQRRPGALQEWGVPHHRYPQRPVQRRGVPDTRGQPRLFLDELQQGGLPRQQKRVERFRRRTHPAASIPSPSAFPKGCAGSRARARPSRPAGKAATASCGSRPSRAWPWSTPTTANATSSCPRYSSSAWPSTTRPSTASRPWSSVRGAGRSISPSPPSATLSRKNRFKTMLRGFDRDWSAETGQRQVSYTNLPPGSYMFRVIACNNDGEWNRDGASLRFTLRPYFFQTPWFRTLAALAVLLLAALAFRLRFRSLRRRERELEVVVGERTKELSRVNEELVQANHVQEELQRIAVHDLKNPLQAIMGAADLIKRRNPELAGGVMLAEKISWPRRACWG